MLPLLSFLFLGIPLVAASSSPEPCALITKQIREHQKYNNSASVQFPVQLAEDCLQSMPFYPELADLFLEELGKYVQWQSTLETLKNPPDTYMSSPTDILDGLETIRNTKYSSQWQFDQAIKALINSANDGHFYVELCSFTPFTFMRNTALVSVSMDGIKAPEIYTLTDAELLNRAQAEVSPVVSIDGRDASSYLKEIEDQVLSQDPDARYNTLFFSFSGNPGGVLDGRNVYPGSNITTLEFRNGSTLEVKNMAKLNDPGFEARNGKDVFDMYCRPTPSNSSDNSSTSEPDVKPPLKSGPVGYPEPLIRDPYNQMNGYYLDDDTVVMMIPSFDGDGLPPNQSLTFGHYATKIVSKALADGRTKLIIDVSGNPGGDVDRAFNLFKLFFPSEFPYSANRFRRHEVSEGLVKIFSAVNRSTALENIPNNVDFMAYSVAVTPDQEAGFESYEDFLGDTTDLGTPVSSLFASFNFTEASGNSDTPIRGYAGRPLNRTQPFKAGNILIIGDGLCASTCSIFVNLMTNIGGVRALPFGGHPNGQPMQIMGGVRGSQTLTFDDIATAVSVAKAVYRETPEKLEFITKEENERLMKLAPRPLEEFPIKLGAGQVNFLNAYQEGDDDLPLQFQYQAGDCRLYYTAENIYHPETIWKSAKEAIWGNRSCVKGSTGGTGSLEGRKKGKKNESEGG
ncbi:hypothetical protein BKA60DRAFT_656445 [Fusarium oxysporum]|uniref:Uncharacterized protein n=1 Tax=Fusarium oxysporum TaxID=5507 RepID=A0A420MWM9_FUSOX|nr:hypothetical protein BKA60DRAFT_656445 [Fusarium oxysporum]RKK72430.1 hypothetical protein BFJ69_g10111 [Fusarium oxysporum]